MMHVGAFVVTVLVHKCGKWYISGACCISGTNTHTSYVYVSCRLNLNADWLTIAWTQNNTLGVSCRRTHNIDITGYVS